MSLRIGFFAESCIPFHGRSLEERPLGGTETGIIRLSEALAKNGHDVTVFTKANSFPSCSVTYLSPSQIAEVPPFDVLVLVKDPQPIAFHLPAKRVYFLTGDGPDQFVNYGLGDKRVSSKLSGLLTVSDWQGQALSSTSGFPIQKCFFIGNGVHLPYFEGVETRMPKRLIYASAPYRGLHLALAAFHEVKKVHPDAEFHLFTGFDVYDTDSKFSGPLVDQYKKLKDAALHMPGCFIHGNVTQEALAREYMKSSILLYPNTIFETCSIVSLEAQAAGCVAVTSNNSGIAESLIDGGIVINGQPGSKPYMTQLISTVTELLSDKHFWSTLSRSAKDKAVNSLSWQHVSNRFDAAVRESLN